MSVAAPPRRPQRPDDVEALIEEARRRARRRRLGYAVFLLFLGVGLGLYFGVGHDGGGAGPNRQIGRGPGAVTPSAQARQITRVGARTVIGEAGLVAPDVGWAMNGLGFWWTRDGGQHWRTITPHAVRATGDVVARVVDVAATDDVHIWIAAADIAGRSGRHMAIERTTDAGKTWQSVVPPGCESCAGAHLSFVNDHAGFALAGAQPSPRLYETSDGGATWRRVPGNVSFTGPIRFLNMRDGWAVSQPARMIGASQSVPVGGGIVYRTGDGGRTWLRVTLLPPQRYRGHPATAGIPHFFGMRNGVVPARFRDRLHAQHVVVYVTTNGGKKWTARSAPGDADLRAESWGSPEALPFSAATVSDWFLLVGHGLYATHDGGRSWSVTRTVAPPAPRAWDLVFISPTTGWAIFAPFETGPHAGAALVRTTDGGRQWSPLAPP